MAKIGFTLELQINGKSWTAYYENVEVLIIRRRAGANKEIYIKEIISAEDPIDG